MPDISDLAKIGATTAGASSPISIPLTGSPVSSGSNAPNTALFGAFQVGGAGNQATDSLPTPANLLGSNPVSSLLSAPTIGLIVAVGAAAYLLMHGFKK